MTKAMLILTALTAGCIPPEMPHARFVEMCHLVERTEGKLERTRAYCAGKPTEYGFVYMRGDFCYDCTDGVKRCYAEGDEP